MGCSESSFSPSNSGSRDNSSGNQSPDPGPFTQNQEQGPQGPGGSIGGASTIITAATCDDPNVSKKSTTVQLSFPAHQGCSWDTGESSAAFKGKFTQTDILTIPEGATLCNLRDFKSLTNTVDYDDFLYLVFDEFLVVGRAAGFVSRLDKRLDLPVWDWSKIEGTSWGDEDSLYCLGADSTCVYPEHDDTGGVNIQLGVQTMKKIAEQVQLKNSIPFRLISTGDDDSGDCRHSGLELTITADYVGG